MRYSTHIELVAEADLLTAKKRLGRNQQARLTAIGIELSHTTQPPATLRRAPTGERADFQGNVYEAHRVNRFGAHGHLRMMRRSKQTGRDGIKFMRSRIQRTRRKQRTGGVR